MSLQLGDTAPDFTLDSTEGPVHFHDYAGSRRVVFFSHPKDFTPVCTTELGAFARRKGEFDARNTRLIGLSADSVADHRGWAKDVEDAKQLYPAGWKTLKPYLRLVPGPQA